VILGGKRTAIGTFMGGLSRFTAPHLGSIALKGAIQASHINKDDIEEVYVGNVVSSGIGQAPDRQVVLGAELDKRTISTLVNKVCASGMKTVMLGATSIRAGERSVIAAGGMESMS